MSADSIWTERHKEKVQGKAVWYSPNTLERFEIPMAKGEIEAYAFRENDVLFSRIQNPNSPYRGVMVSTRVDVCYVSRLVRKGLNLMASGMGCS